MPFFGKSGTSRISFFNPSQSTDLGGILATIVKLSSSHLKRIESRSRLRCGFFYVIHARRSRTLPQTRPQPSQLLARSHGQNFDAAIGIVAHPSGDLQDVCLTLNKPAKPDALDAPAHKKAPSLNVRLIVDGSHRSIEERSIEDLPYCARDR
jgi:hypothetical protein